MSMTDRGTALADAVAAMSCRMRSTSRTGCTPTPEIAFEERQAAAWSAELLARHGFEVTAPAGGLETAFVARWQGTGPGRSSPWPASTTRCRRSATAAGTT